MRRLESVHVVIPARDEEDRIGACLESVALARAAVHETRIATSVTVVLDRCTDRTAVVARAHGADAVVVDAGCVGLARRAGVQTLVDRGVDPATALVVNTDADCVVPPTWLLDHLALAADHHLVQGEVAPIPEEMAPAALARWLEQNVPGSGSLHGANLGFRLDAYMVAGGFPPVAEQEDLLLVRAMKALGMTSIGGTTVLTSARREGRTAGGFAGYLRALDLTLEDPTG